MLDRDRRPLGRADLQDMADNIKKTRTAVVADVQTELRELTLRMSSMEDQLSATITQTQAHASSLEAHSDLLC